MSKKDYQAIAAALYQTQPFTDLEPGHELSEDREAVVDQWRMDRDALARVLQANNPRFDRARFIEACETGRCRGMRPASETHIGRPDPNLAYPR